MKKLIFSAAILASCLSIKVADAQLRINVNIGSQPAWGPVGYSHADYYYMPDIDAYYDVPAHQYIYFDNNVWVRRAYLPERYGNYDLYHGYKVVVNQRNPWERDDIYRSRYANYRGRHDQGVIRDSRDERYRNHWNGDANERGHYDNGNHGGRGNQFHQDNGNHGDQGRGHDNGNHGGDQGRGHDNGGHGDKGHGGDHGN